MLANFLYMFPSNIKFKTFQSHLKQTFNKCFCEEKTRKFSVLAFYGLITESMYYPRIPTLKETCTDKGTRAL